MGGIFGKILQGDIAGNAKGLIASYALYSSLFQYIQTGTLRAPVILKTQEQLSPRTELFYLEIFHLVCCFEMKKSSGWWLGNALKHPTGKCT
jgi:hypothetical protein